MTTLHGKLWPSGMIAFVFVASTLARQTSAADTGPGDVEFNRDIRPILSDKCFVCHGPDSAKRAAGLRLDQRESAIASQSGTRAIVPRDSSSSELIRRVRSQDPDEMMPPPATGTRLNANEIQLLTRWIDEGAEYQPHWSLVPPAPPDRTSLVTAPSAFNPIDDFVLHRLGRSGLSPATPADRWTLIRRLSFDLTGLPPTLAEAAEFVADGSPDACERLVDRLLASPRYGERMASNWLDAARFADTNGYQTDGPRFMWRWRDWVIEAFNQNQPFDQFTLDQLAGDLIERRNSTSTKPHEHLKQRASAGIANARLIATGFNRNHRGNAEGGIIPEEFRIEYVVDRVETTSTVWLGMTIGCARCHDHKYDPISQQEFYQLFAFFNQVPEPGKYIRNGNSMPYLPAPTSEQQRELTRLDSARQQAERAWQALAPDVTAGMNRLAATMRGQSQDLDWCNDQGLDSHLTLDGGTQVRRPAGSSAKHSSIEDVARQSGGATGLDTESHAEWQEGSEAYVAGMFGQAASFNGRAWIVAKDMGDFGEDESFVISCWVKPFGTEAMTILARMDHENSSRGYELRRESNGRLQVLISGRILDDLIRVETDKPLPVDEWSHLLMTYDGSSAARGVTVRVNGEPVKLAILVDLLSNPIRVKLPLCVGGGGSAAPFKGLIDEVRCYRGRLTAEVARSLAASQSLSEIVMLPMDTVRGNELDKFREFYLSRSASEQQTVARQRLLETQEQYASYLSRIPTTMVMEDSQTPRETRVLIRGEYDKPGKVVKAALPAALASGPQRPAEDAHQPLDRLDLARWLVSPQNPLTARVTVNRIWQQMFGVGLVKTVEDFGTQGEDPSHPKLLDWLALEFSQVGRPPSAVPIDAGHPTLEPSPPQRADGTSNWDLKRLLRTIVASATYRQSSVSSAQQRLIDPENRWVSRGPRVRLPAEMVRDAALRASGLLVESLGGPSVKPYQPAGLWEELSAEAVPGAFSLYVQDHGANLYRRSLYTYRKRTAPPPSMAIFDSSSRETCRVSLPRTNTPIQALNLMNDVTYVEAARVLAERAMTHGGATDSQRLDWAVRNLLVRPPESRELQLLLEGLASRRRLFQAETDLAEQLVSQGEQPANPTIDRSELAAMTATLSVVMNLDEFIMKP